jgi:hypothetical protein
MDALAGEPRANAHYMELHREDVARRGTSCASAHEYSGAVCASIQFVKVPRALICALVTCSPCQAPSSSCSLNCPTYTPKVSSLRLSKASLAPHTSGSRDVPRCEALSLLQKTLYYRRGSSKYRYYAERKFVDLGAWLPGGRELPLFSILFLNLFEPSRKISNRRPKNRSREF